MWNINPGHTQNTSLGRNAQKKEEKKLKVQIKKEEKKPKVQAKKEKKCLTQLTRRRDI